MDIVLSKRAVKSLNSINEPLLSRIEAGIYGLPNGDVKRLKGYAATFRLRIGEYRIIFELTADEIYISDILPRGSAYKK
jgi:mRNA interferase RelE/StbE